MSEETWDGYRKHVPRVHEEEAHRPPGEPVWEYTFATWPEEQSPRWNKAAYKLWDFALKGFAVMEFTEREFNDFREELAKCGISLREITRRPHVEGTLVL